MNITDLYSSLGVNNWKQIDKTRMASLSDKEKDCLVQEIAQSQLSNLHEYLDVLVNQETKNLTILNKNDCIYSDINFVARLFPSLKNLEIKKKEDQIGTVQIDFDEELQNRLQNLVKLTIQPRIYEMGCHTLVPLLKRGVKIECQDGNSRDLFAMSIACWRKYASYTTNQGESYVDLFEACLENELYFSANLTSFFQAFLSLDTEKQKRALDLILQKQPKMLSQVDENQETLFHWLFGHHMDDLLNKILSVENLEPCNIKDKKGRTPLDLLYASYEGFFNPQIYLAKGFKRGKDC